MFGGARSRRAGVSRTQFQGDGSNGLPTLGNIDSGRVYLSIPVLELTSPGLSASNWPWKFVCRKVKQAVSIYCNGTLVKL